MRRTGKNSRRSSRGGCHAPRPSRRYGNAASDIAYMYHTTAASKLPSIRKNGLSPRLAGRWIYLAVDPAQSAAYDAWYTGKKAVLLRITVSKLDERHLGPDDMDLQDILEQQDDDRTWSDVDWRESLRLSGQATYDDVIPPNAIEVMKVWQA